MILAYQYWLKFHEPDILHIEKCKELDEEDQAQIPCRERAEI